MKIKPEKAEDYAKAKAANADPYGSEIHRFAEAWADLMEHAMEENGETLAACAERCADKTDTEGITVFMYGSAVSVLSGVWEHGDELRRWHNNQYEPDCPDDGRVINPALINNE